MVFYLLVDGTARRKGATTSGVALRNARKAKEKTYPELTGDGGRAWLVVLAAGVGGRWSEETALILGPLAKTRAQESLQFLQGRATGAYVSVGALCWRAVWQSPSHCCCWISDQSPASERTSLRA